MSKFDELKKLAKAASPGPWTYEGLGFGENGGRYYGVADAEFNEVAGEFGLSEKNAQYIAVANPAAILELLAIQAQLVEGLKIIAAGHGCPSALAADTLASVGAQP